MPSLAVAVFAVRKRVSDATVLGLIALAGIGGIGYIFFWLWLLDPLLGRVLSFCLPVASVAYLYPALRAMPPEGKTLLKSLLVPTALTLSAALLVLATGSAYGGVESTIRTPATRFSHPLPSDNWIPYVFAVKVAHHDAAAGPLMGDWRSSDRPPLQTGILLSEFAYFHGEEDYAVLGTLLQSTWIFALFLFLRAFDVDPAAVRLVLAVCLFSGFIFINSFFVWPKLLAAAYTLGCFTICIPAKFETLLRRSALVAAIAGCLLAFGMLAHGGSVFAALGLVATLCVLRKRIGLKALATVAVTGFLVYLPWLGYQRLYDPPGDRLLKWHLAGVHDVDPRPFFQVLVGAYENLGMHRMLANKAANVTTVVGHLGEYTTSVISVVVHLGTGGSVAAQNAWAARSLMFFFYVPNLGFLALGLPAFFIAYFKRRDCAEWKTAGVLWLFTVITVTIWCLLMFSPTSTVIHQGTYVTVLLAYAASLLGLWVLRRWLAIAVGTLQILLNILLYVIAMRWPVPGTYVPEGQVRIAMLFVCGVCVVAVVGAGHRSLWSRLCLGGVD